MKSTTARAAAAAVILTMTALLLLPGVPAAAQQRAQAGPAKTVLIDFSDLAGDMEEEGQRFNERTRIPERISGEENPDTLSYYPAQWQADLVPSHWETGKERSGDEILIRHDPIRPDARKFPGLSVFRVSGTLDSDYPEAYVFPPFPAPPTERFEGLGSISGPGPVKEIRLSVRNDGDPVRLTLRLEDDENNIIPIDFEIAAAPGVWFTMSYRNPFAEVERRFDEFRLGSLRLLGMEIGSTPVAEAGNRRYLKIAGMTAEERYRYEQDNPPQRVESSLDLLIKQIVVYHY
jgi:hypothetical protein